MHRPSLFQQAWSLMFGLSVSLSAGLGYGQSQTLEQDQPPEPLVAADLPVPWTLLSARSQLEMYPKDPFLQYVYWQLSQRAGDSINAEQVLRQWQGMPPNRGGRAQNVDLFSLFSGALAVQESLQLDALTNAAAPAGDAGKKVAMRTLSGPTIKSHPWSEILDRREPKIGRLAQSVPDDFLFVSFRSIEHLVQSMAIGDQLGALTFHQLEENARTQSLPIRLQRQLMLDGSSASVAQLGTAVGQLALVSSDLFFQEGTDTTLLMELKEPVAYRTWIEAADRGYAQQNQHITRTSGTWLGVAYDHWSTADRQVHAFSAYPRPDLHVRTNSEVALRRIVEAIQGKTSSGLKVDTLGESDEYRYVRTLMEEQAVEEDVWVYLSDPFIRKLVGPQSKLTQRRRLMCYNHMRMIGHASMLHRTEHASPAESMEALRQSKCLPDQFGKKSMVCPDGGVYTLCEDGVTGCCSHHGSIQAMKPCCEIPVERVSPSEAADYQEFLRQYNQYWRTFFDPIAIRIQLAPKRYRVETIILPLIDNSIYTELASRLGGTPSNLDAMPVPKRNIFTMALQWNKEKMLSDPNLQVWLRRANENEESASFEPIPKHRLRHMQRLVWAMMRRDPVQVGLPPTHSPGFSKGLSWRVQILPELGLKGLYDRFHLDEPWDSPHNLALISEIPEVYRTGNDEAIRQGKTTMVMPLHDRALSTKGTSRKHADITDGADKTILLVDVDPDQAVVWTQPEDLTIDWQRPREGWTGYRHGESLVAMANGVVWMMPSQLEDDVVRSFLSRDGGESITQSALRLPPRDDAMWIWNEEAVRRTHLGDFLSKGIGDQISLNIYDNDPLIDLNVSRFLGMMGFRFGSAGGINFFDYQAMLSLLVISLNSPVYVSVPVLDPKIVDRSLDGLDELLAVLARRNSRRGNTFFSIEQDFYRFQGAGDAALRAYAFRFGPLKWRFYWGRIGQGLYLASKPYILQDLVELEGVPQRLESAGEEVHTAHAMLRLRPKQWQEVLMQYRIGWAESQRERCLCNLGPLSSLSRVAQVTTSRQPNRIPLHESVRDLELRSLDSSAYCPAGGEYEFREGDCHVECSIHGSVWKPRQPMEPAVASPMGSLMQSLKDVRLELTFLEEGLKAVATMDLE